MPRSRPLFVVVASALAIALSACGVGRPAAATVGIDRITDDQLAKDMAVFRFLSALNRQPCGQASSGETSGSACARFTLSTLIQEDVIKGYAGTHHIVVDDAKVSSTIDQLQSTLGAGLGQQLHAQGLTQDDLRAIVRRILLFNDVETAVTAKSVSDADLQSLYEQQRQRFTQIHAKHILVRTQAAAQRIERRVTPRNFGRLAQRYSIDTGSASKGGDLGTIPATSLDPTFVQAATALRPGQISPPVQTQFGWHIILLVEVSVAPLSQVRDQLAGPLRAQAFSDWLKREYARLHVSVNPRYGRFDPSTGNVEPIRSTARTSSPPASSASPSAGSGSAP